MKKSVLIFVVVFALAYLGSCYLVPGWRIKLAATPVVYLISSLQHMVLFKTMIAAAIAAVAAVAMHLFAKKEA